MTKQLEAIFGELGIAQYLDVFLDQGFDTWETILDITESDLDALGVKLGHRRKLQRRIANSRGVAPDASLLPLATPSIEELKHDPQVNNTVKIETRDVTTVVVAKRKYRRHPKPDENAPERPPSAYVLFSNKMRDDLKGRNLTFTEIAKLVGEHWQNLSPTEKEPFESQAQTAKDKYNNELADYKKTPQHKKYMQYLQEFKAKYAHQSQDKDAAKRVKLSSMGEPHSESNTTTPSRRSRSDSGSGSEDPHMSGPASKRHARLGSVVSAADSQVSATPAQHHGSADEAVYSPSLHTLGRRSSERSPIIGASPRDIAMTHLRGSGWQDEQRAEPPRLLPSLSDVLDHRSVLNSGTPSSEASGFPFPRTYNPDSAGPPPPLIGGETKPPGLTKEQSSAGSVSSGSSYGFPRTPIESTLPIHALLSEKTEPPFGSMAQFHGSPMLQDQTTPGAFQQLHSLNGVARPYMNGTSGGATPTNPPQALTAPWEGLSSGPVHIAQQSPPPSEPQHSYVGQAKIQHSKTKPEPNFDGMSALLRAGEIVDRRSR